MTEVEAKVKKFIPARRLAELVKEITGQLNEPNVALISRIVIAIGEERARALLSQVLAIEADGGQMTVDGTRRKTPGGIFISTARAQAGDKKERRKLLDQVPTPASAPTAPLTWDEVGALLQQVFQSIGEAKTVKITLIGRPSKVMPQASCVVLAMKGKEPPTFPKGLPTPPAGSAITWAVFVATKQWEKVKDSLEQHPDDQLLLEGYPMVDPRSKANVVLVTSCKSVLQDRAQRDAKKSNP
jgi:hypothetical protein